MTAATALTGDAPKLKLSDDQFELATFARGIAAALIDRVTRNGYAIGIEGTWGSGKTTLLNFIANVIEVEHTGCHRVFWFAPWLIGRSDELFQEYFSLLSQSIKTVGSDTRVYGTLNNDPHLIDRLSARVAQYGQRVSKRSA
jgi:predicted KAP-like P-loop ATPase